MKYFLLGSFLMLMYGVVFAFAQELPRASERLGVAGLSGLLVMLAFMSLSKWSRERRRK